MPHSIPGVKVAENPMYLSSDRIVSLAAPGVSPAGNFTRQFMNPIYDCHEEDDEPKTDYAPDYATMWRDKAGIVLRTRHTEPNMQTV